MFSFAKMKEDQIKRMDDFEERCKEMFKDCPVLRDLLNAPKMSAYKVGGLNVDNYESVEMNMYSLHHAFIDDGGWKIKRKVHEDLTSLRKRLGINPYHSYDILPGEAWEDDELPLTPEILEEFLKLDAVHYDYYEEHGDEIEKRERDENGKLVFNKHNKEYFKLVHLARDYFDTLFEEAYSE